MMRDAQFDRGYSIGEIARQTSVNIETIRYYERIGIMPEPDRLANGYRQFSHDHLKRLSFVKKCRELGFTLKEVHTMLMMVDSDNLSCGEIHEMTTGHLDAIEQRIRRLRKLKGVLSKMADQCTQGNVPECPVIDALFEAA
jgi:MerR family transcriptional regulator, mercuric resistance operon regulatory protein